MLKNFMRLIAVLLCVAPAWSVAQMNPAFFPQFQPYAANPIMRYGDGFADASWNDPTILKENGQYIMYITSASGFILSDSNTVKVYRQVSPDGYNWTLSPSYPVVESAPGTYYAGGTETPSVVLKNGVYHMYLTCYPPGNVSTEFVIGHATSPDGLQWTMDTTPILESDGSATFYGILVGEPGAIVYHDSIYVFFAAAGTVASQSVQAIGVIKSADGTHFGTPQQAVSMPQSVYPLSSDYWGLSTPSALAIHDSIHLFTDVAQTINGQWTQVALHQFKTDGQSGIWYHDTLPIHTRADFSWTDGDYLSEIRSITPFLEDNGLLRIWYAGNRLADVVGIDTTYHIFIDSLGGIHADPDFWGIGTSEYQFSTASGMAEDTWDGAISLFPNPVSGMLHLRSTKPLRHATLSVTDLSGRTIRLRNDLEGSALELNLEDLEAGIYFVRIQMQGQYWSGKIMVQD